MRKFGFIAISFILREYSFTLFWIIYIIQWIRRRFADSFIYIGQKHY